VREKLRSYFSRKNPVTFNELERRVKGRLKGIKDWIGFSEDDLKKWQEISVKFVKWFDDNLKEKKISQEEFSSRFPALW
jgi:predicted HicB family RNase H-like nuclease